MELIEMADRGKGLVQLIFDTAEPLTLYYSEVKHLCLEPPMPVNEQLYHALYDEILGKRVTKRAMYLLQKMDRTEAQLRAKLLDNEYPEELIERAIAYVKSYHYIDDARYAGNYIRTYKETKSRRRLQQDLQQRGIDESTIALALEEENDTNQSELIQRLLEKRRYDPQTATQKEKQKMYRFLLGRGFLMSDIMRAL